MTTSEAARAYKLKRNDADIAKKTLALAKEEEGKAEAVLIDAMLEEGVNSVKLAGIGNFILTNTSYLNVVAADKVAFFPFLREYGHGGVIKEDINSNTLKATLKDLYAQLIKDFEAKGKDAYDAKKEALELLAKHGCKSYSEQGITFRKEP